MDVVDVIDVVDGIDMFFIGQVVAEHAGQSVLFTEAAQVVQEAAQYDDDGRGAVAVARVARHRVTHDFLPRRAEWLRTERQRAIRRQRRSLDVVTQFP